MVQSDVLARQAQRGYYDRLWSGVDADSLNDHERARLKIIARLLRGNLSRAAESPTILEVGCGRGWLSGLVLQQLGDVRAIDLSPASVRKATERFPRVAFRAQDVFSEGLPPENDIVVCSEVLEHVEDQRAFAAMLCTAVKPSGLVLVTTPNARWKRRWMARSRTRPQPLEQWLLPGELASLLAPHCHTIRHTTVFVPWDYASHMGRAMIRMDRTLGRLGPGEVIASLGGGLYSVLLARRTAT